MTGSRDRIEFSNRMNCSCEELVDIQLGHGVEHPPLRQTPVCRLRFCVAHPPAAGSVNPKYLYLFLLARLQMILPFPGAFCSRITKDQDHSILRCHLKRLTNRWKEGKLCSVTKRQPRSTKKAHKNNQNRSSILKHRVRI